MTPRDFEFVVLRVVLEPDHLPAVLQVVVVLEGVDSPVSREFGVLAAHLEVDSLAFDFEHEFDIVTVAARLEVEVNVAALSGEFDAAVAVGRLERDAVVVELYVAVAVALVVSPALLPSPSPPPLPEQPASTIAPSRRNRRRSRVIEPPERLTE